MKFNYIKQAVSSIRQEPMVGTVSMIGTALAILLIMVMMMISEIKVAPYSPESNRDRWLVYRFGSITNDHWDTDASSNGPFGFNTVKQVFYPMTTPEEVTAFSVMQMEAVFSVPGGKGIGATLHDVDDRFWNVMDFTFISGKPFTREDFDAGIPVVVIGKKIARKLFGSTDVVGQQVLINHIPYRISGVVEDVSELAQLAYGEAWVPFTTTTTVNSSWSTYMGSLSVVMLAKSPDDFPKIRAEVADQFAKFEDETKINGWHFIQRERPYTQYVQANTPWANLGPDMKSVELHKLVVYAILIIVPAINLSNMTQSRLRRRREEIGVKRAFGATRGDIIREIFIENLVISIVAGAVGLILSVIVALMWKNGLFGTSNVSIGMLLHWSTFGWALLFCFLLNLLSAGIPVWRASRVNVVEALNK